MKEQTPWNIMKGFEKFVNDKNEDSKVKAPPRGLQENGTYVTKDGEVITGWVAQKLSELSFEHPTQEDYEAGACAIEEGATVKGWIK